MKPYIFMLAAGIFILFLILFGLWDTYRPHTGPVGNGIDDNKVIREFMIQLITPIGFITAGIIGILLEKKKK
ncbi:hypothetical protein ACFPYJ_05150 [Paenibacillus solisilvae]|uniref:DUF3955 domain-containing protein n=1 Tax=Paenibacillus solisilvae TaxID=2486751 RepID=A0ABW0VRJ7_9BACL